MIRIINNFISREGALAVRNSALASGFGAWTPPTAEVGSGYYAGMNFMCEHSIMLHALARAIGQVPIPNSMFCRVTNSDTEKAYVHSDREAGSFTCVAYLSEHEGQSSGTGFYRHRETGMTSMPSFAELRQNPELFEKLKKQMVEGDEKDWELTDFCSGAFGKAVIFDAPLFHARNPKNGFGDTSEEGRMVWVSHFRLISKDGGLTA